MLGKGERRSKRGECWKKEKKEEEERLREIAYKKREEWNFDRKRISSIKEKENKTHFAVKHTDKLHTEIQLKKTYKRDA